MCRIQQELFNPKLRKIFFVKKERWKESMSCLEALKKVGDFFLSVSESLIK